ncbi:MAG: hypothetical protein Q8L55_02960, partial [Phycisphaerales bacterium]|nr:hypothetical protein [Phycisphaerales bacterium]
MADTRGIRAGRAFVELGVSDKLSAGLKAAQKKLEAFGAGLRSIGTKMAGIGVAAVTALLGTVKAFSDSGDALDKMSQRTGVSVEALSELGYAADLSGTDMETLENGLRVMQKSLVEAAKGSQGANEALGLLGLTVADLAKLSPDEQFKLLADRISKVQDPALRASLAMELFGKAGTKLLPLMADGAAGINEMQEQARKLGLTVSTETARDAAELNDALGTLWKVLKQGVFTIGGALAPTIKELTERITRVIVSATAWIKENKDLVVWALKVAAAVAVAGIAIIALGYIISGIGAALGLVAGIIGGIGTAFGLIGAAIGAILSPIGLVIAAIVALGGVLVVASGVGGEALTWLGEQFTALREWVSKVVGGIADALAAGDISLAAEILWLSLKVIWQQGVAALNKAWLGAKEFFVSTAYSMWYGALAAAEIVFHALEVSWIETTAFLSKTWTNFTTGFQQVWESASLWVAKPPHGQNPSAELSFIVLDSSRGRGAVHLRARPAHPHGVCAYTPRTNGDAKMTVNKFLVAVIVLFMHCFTALTASAQPQPTPWDADDPVNKAQTRQYLSLIWQAEINGQQVDLSQFEFSNDLPEVMGLLVGPQKEVFEKLYSHRLDPHGLQGLPYGLNELLRDDATVRAQFREFVLTDKITLGPDADPEAANKHLLMIMDGIFAQAEFTVEA